MVREKLVLEKRLEGHFWPLDFRMLLIGMFLIVRYLSQCLSERYGQEPFGGVNVSKINQESCKKKRREEGWRWSVGKHQHSQHRLRKRECGKRLRSDKRGKSCEINVVN